MQYSLGQQSEERETELRNERIKSAVRFRNKNMESECKDRDLTPLWPHKKAIFLKPLYYTAQSTVVMTL